jgi:hypothetical protein
MSSSSFPDGFTSTRKHAISIDALDEAVRATGIDLPATLRALFVDGTLSLGGSNGLTLFDEDLLDQFNVPAGPLPDFLEQPQSDGDKLLAEIYSDHRLEGSEGMFFFASDVGGVCAFIDGRGRLGRGVGAVFAIYPGDGGCDAAEFVAVSFDEFLDLVIEEWRSRQRVDLRSLADRAARGD